jgi:hypothetical protein
VVTRTLIIGVDGLRRLRQNQPRVHRENLLEGDHAALAAAGKKGIEEIVVTTDEFEKIVLDWPAAAKHPKYQRPYTELVYQPMLELLAYLRANGFKTFIVSGGGIDFMRPFTEKVYGIPPEQFVGSMAETKFELRDGEPVLVKESKLFFMDDKEGKPIGIQNFIVRPPIHRGVTTGLPPIDRRFTHG